MKRGKGVQQLLCGVLALILLGLAGCGDGMTGGEEAGSVPSQAGEVPRTSAPEPTPTQEPSPTPYVYDPTVSTGMDLYDMNDPDEEDRLLRQFREYGWNLPDEIYWLDWDALDQRMGMKVIGNACSDGVLYFDCTTGWATNSKELGALYGLTEEEMELGKMSRWPWEDWRFLAIDFALYVTVRPQEEAPMLKGWLLPDPEKFSEWEFWEDAVYSGALQEEGRPTPRPTPVGYTREHLEDYQYPAWEPVEGHEGVETAVVETLPNGRILSARVRWQQEGFWFLAEVPGHLLDSFLENAPALWEKVEMDVPDTPPEPDPDWSKGVASVAGDE